MATIFDEVLLVNYAASEARLANVPVVFLAKRNDRTFKVVG
jgi:hypothetical protein